MKRWPFIVLAVAFVAFVATACAPPAPAAWYSAATDTIHYDDAQMAKVYAWYGQPGVDWITAHEEGHRTTVYLLRRGVDVQTMMPGATVMIRLEQAAQCLAEAKLGRPAPWQWGPAEVALGYWDCPASYVTEVAAA